MAQLSEHFSEAELRVEHAEERVRENARFLCEKLLEPIREHFGQRLYITSGYRSPAKNAAIGGVATSEHLYVGGKAAADFFVNATPLRAVFDWIRLKSKLPFDQVILEHDQSGTPACIHIASNSANGARRLAGIRGTGTARDYKAVEVAG